MKKKTHLIILNYKTINGTVALKSKLEPCTPVSPGTESENSTFTITSLYASDKSSNRQGFLCHIQSPLLLYLHVKSLRSFLSENIALSTFKITAITFLFQPNFFKAITNSMWGI